MKMIRDALGSPIPQTLNSDGSYTALANGDATGINFKKYKMLRDSLGSPLPYQYFDVEQDKFVPGAIGGGYDGELPDATTDRKGIVQLENTLESTSTTKAPTAAVLKQVNDKVENVGTKVVDKVSVLEYEHLKVLTANGYDWQPVFQHIVNTFGGNVEIVVPYRAQPYKLSRKVLIPTNQSFILSSDVLTTVVATHDTFSDAFLFEMQGGYFCIENITLSGNNKDGITLFGGTKGLYNAYRIKKIRLYDAEYGIRLDGACEFPLGGQMEDVWAYNIFTNAIKLSTDSDPTSGQSCHEYNNIRINNSNVHNRTENLASNISITEGTTSDTITWSNANQKEYGWVIMKKPKGNGENWVHAGQTTGTTITVNKTSGSQWDYTVLRRTVGMKIKHLKSVNFGVLQSEYCTNGIIVERCTGVVINAFYNEWRAFTATNMPNTTGDGIYVEASSGFTLLGGWQEFGRNLVRFRYSTATFVTGVRGVNLSSSIIFYEGNNQDGYHRVGSNTAVGTTSAVIDDDGSVYSKNYIADNPKHNSTKTGTTNGIENVISHGIKARQAIQYRGGIQEGSLEVDSTGSTLKVNKLLVSSNDKNLEAPFQVAQHTQISSRNVATPILKIAFPENSTSMFAFNYAVEVQGSNYVVRHVEGGTLKIAIVKTISETAKFKVSVDDRISITETFSATVTGEIETATGNLIVKMTVDNGWMDNGGFARVRLVPISVLKPSNTTTVTQL